LRSPVKSRGFAAKAVPGWGSADHFLHLFEYSLRIGRTFCEAVPGLVLADHFLHLFNGSLRETMFEGFETWRSAFKLLFT
jgi:hypothetical protein